MKKTLSNLATGEKIHNKDTEVTRQFKKLEFEFGEHRSTFFTLATSVYCMTYFLFTGLSFANPE